MLNKLYRAALITTAAAFFAVISLASFSVNAKGVYQSGPDFFAEVFAPLQAEPKVLWLTPEIRAQASVIVDRPVRGLRVRYHQSNNKTAWILEEIGKEMPITIGVVVENDVIKQVKILAYRESRGGEVRYPFFTRQFERLGLIAGPDKMTLDGRIDGITGATLSVRAITKVATLALYFHHNTPFNHVGA